MRLFDDLEPDTYTWDDWRDEVRRDYPVRYFLSEVLSLKARTYWNRVTDAWYWVLCQVHPKYRGYAKLDLRNPSPTYEYTHGWMDTNEVLLVAPFVALRRFVETEAIHKSNPHEWTTEYGEDWTEHRRSYDEMWALYHWWMVGRGEEQAEENRLFEAYTELRKTQGRRAPDVVAARDQWMAYQVWASTTRPDEMLIRLIRIRGYLWT